MTQVQFFDRVRVTTAATGSGSPITLGAAVAGFRSFVEAGVPDGAVVPYTIEEGSEQEVGHGIYTAAGNTLTRVVSSSSNADAPIVLFGNAQLFITPTAASLVGRQTIGMPAHAMIGRASNPPVALSEETTTNKNMITGWRFATGVDRFVQFRAPMPLSYAIIALRARLLLRAPVVTSGNARFRICVAAIDDDRPSDTAFGTPAIIDAAVKSTAGNIFISAESGQFISPAVPAHPFSFQFELYRAGAEGADTALGDVDLLDAWIYYDTLGMHDTP